MSGNRKTERLFNLLIMLLVQRRYVAKERIREILYPDARRRRLREDVRARQGGAAQPRRARSRWAAMDAYFDDEPGYRIRPDQLALPEISLTRRRGRRGRPGHQGLGARQAGRGHHRGGAQAHGVRRPGRRRRPRHRRAADRRRRAVLRRLLGRRAGRAPRSSSTTGAPGSEPTHPAPAAVGRRALLRAAGTPWAGTPTATTSGSSGSPGSQGAARRDGEPGAYDIPPGTDVARDRRAARPAAADRAGHGAGPPRRRPVLRRRATEVDRGRRRPRRRGAGTG